MSSPTIQKFLELEKKKEEYKKYIDEFNTTLEQLVKEIGVDAYFQDNDGIVFKTVIPEGKFVYFDKFGYLRTKRSGETRGSLSVKEAEENGFKVK